MALELWTSADLYDVLRDDRMDPVPSYFLDTFFRETFFSDDKDILWSELPAADRKMAPFVLPTEQGKPIYSAKAETLKALTPPYIKPKDAVRAVDSRQIRPSEILSGQRPSTAERFDARVIEVMNYHNRAIRMNIAYMAAKAFVDAKLTIKYERDQGAAHPEVQIDFGRDPDHTIVLNTTYWDDPDYDIIGDLSDWSNMMYRAKYGARPTRAILGANVVPFVQKNKGILDLLSTQRRGGEGTIVQQGMLNVDEPMSFIGTLGGIGQALELWTYRDQVENNDGSLVELFPLDDVMLVAPGYRGLVAYGAIYDAQAFAKGRGAVDVFPKMWMTEDPGDVFIMNQSSPLPIPLTPNRSLKATVLEG
jgi:hypothetical protein